MAARLPSRRGCVNRDLDPCRGRLPGRNDEVPHQDVGRNTADASCSTLERGTSGSQDAGAGACSEMVPELVLASTVGDSERPGESEAPL